MTENGTTINCSRRHRRRKRETVTTSDNCEQIDLYDTPDTEPVQLMETTAIRDPK